MDCAYLGGCPFYNDKLQMDQGIGSIFKKKYCTGNNELCARYRVLCRLGEGFVPSSLYPNMLDVADEIIEEAGRQWAGK